MKKKFILGAIASIIGLCLSLSLILYGLETNLLFAMIGIFFGCNFGALFGNCLGGDSKERGDEE